MDGERVRVDEESGTRGGVDTGYGLRAWVGRLRRWVLARAWGKARDTNHGWVGLRDRGF